MDQLANRINREGFKMDTQEDKSTPRPWATDGATTDNPKDLVLVASFDLSEGIAQCFKAEDAELIVKAVNDYDKLCHAVATERKEKMDLLEACKEALKCLENPPTDNTSCINQLNQAINQAAK